MGRLPALPAPELHRLIGLLSGIQAGAGQAYVQDEMAHGKRGLEVLAGLGVKADDTAGATRIALALAKAVDVTPFV